MHPVVFMLTQTTGGHSDPHHHTTRIRARLDELIKHLREDIEQVDEPQARALFETTAEVLTGLRTAYEHYERGSEPAFQH